MESYKINFKGVELEIIRLPNGKFKKPNISQFTKQGLGSVWLDDCRIPYESAGDLTNSKVGFGNHLDKSEVYELGHKKIIQDGMDNQGRFPANLLVEDDCVDDGEVRKSTGGSGDKSGNPAQSVYGEYNHYIGNSAGGLGDSGSFSRYFSLDAWWNERIKKLPKAAQRTFPFLVVPKAAKGEKNEGLDGVKDVKTNDFLNSGDVGSKRWCIDNRHPDGGYLQEVKATKNIHPTTKPIKLMSYLITLGSRQGDLVIDPFIGSGTTAIAAYLENRKFIGIEKNEEYFKIAQARVKEAMAQQKLV